MRKALLLGATLAFAAITYINCTKVGEIDAISAEAAQASPSMVVFGYNDLGMHCMNDDFSEICVLPPANTLRATVIDRSENDPKIRTSGIVVSYVVPGNTQSATKTNFWQYAPALFGSNLPDNIGLTGNGLAGLMQATIDRDFEATAIPITPITDAGIVDPYQLAQITVSRNGTPVNSTQAVIPVSWEMRCDNCHSRTRTQSVAHLILKSHDRLHGTNLVNEKPVLCARCHADNALGAPGQPGVSNLSLAMHKAHIERFGKFPPKDLCYSCHPGPQTQCLRDVHKENGLTCQSCHGGMKDVANATRRPWIDEPKCGDCHNVPGHQYEEPGKLFRDSKGHNGVKCIACHGSPHAITPSQNPRDNLQAVALQGSAGPISKCSVCHRDPPEHAFNHTRGDD